MCFWPTIISVLVLFWASGPYKNMGFIDFLVACLLMGYGGYATLMGLSDMMSGVRWISIIGIVAFVSGVMYFFIPPLGLVWVLTPIATFILFHVLRFVVDKSKSQN